MVKNNQKYKGKVLNRLFSSRMAKIGSHKSRVFTLSLSTIFDNSSLVIKETHESHARIANNWRVIKKDIKFYLYRMFGNFMALRKKDEDKIQKKVSYDNFFITSNIFTRKKIMLHDSLLVCMEIEKLGHKDRQKYIFLIKKNSRMFYANFYKKLFHEYSMRITKIQITYKMCLLLCQFEWIIIRSACCWVSE